MTREISDVTRPFDVATFRATLGEPATVRRVLVVDSCSSTQEIARTQADAGAEHGTVVVAERQMEGRGRAGRSWVQLPGALAFSVVLRPRAPAAKWVRLTSLAGLSLVDVTKALGGEAKLKWPNDLVGFPPGVVTAGPLGRARKVAGLLVDGAATGARLDAAILGVGLNVAPAQLPAPLEGIAATWNEIGVHTSRETALAEFLRALDRRLAAVGDDIAYAGAHTALSVASFTLGQRVRSPDGAVGVAVGLDPDGALVIEDEAGTKRLVWAGDVEHVAPEGSK